MVKDSSLDIAKIKETALSDEIPIMQDDTIEFVTTYISRNEIKKILEIGTAVGYSAIMMALSNSLVHITSIEKDKERYMKAVKNVKKWVLKIGLLLFLVML